jgi:co-chaperonin GroES (HSP10)
MEWITHKNNNMIQPIRDFVLVKSELGDNVSEGGIFVPDSFIGRSAKGTIVAVGNGCAGKPMKFKPNTGCWHIKDAGVEVIENDIKYYLMVSNDILAVSEN